MSSARLASQTSFAALVLLGSLGRAIADETAPADQGAPAVESSTEPTAHVGFAVNLPLSWKGGAAVGISGYVGITDHQAIRASFATYKYGANIAPDLLSFGLGGEGDEALRMGRITDVGAAWMYFPRRLWDGFMIEAGALRRDRDITIIDALGAGDNDRTDTQTTTYSARAMVGWSWLIANRAFVSVAAGVSAGYEFGSETTRAPFVFTMPMAMTSDVGRTDISGEGYLRFGAMFDL